MSSNARQFASVFLIAVTVTGMSVLGSGCRNRNSGGATPVSLFLVSFAQNQAGALYRDEALTFDFSIALDPASVDFDTIQVVRLPSRTPVLGLFAVQGALVRFTAVVDEDVPNPQMLPLNPWGFDANAQFEVVIPNQGLKTLRGAQGQPLDTAFRGVFATGSGFAPQPNEPDPVFVPFDDAVYDTTNPPYSPSNPKGTLEAADDVMRYTPLPATPPVNPMTNRPDYRVEHGTNVRVELMFSSVIDPASIRTSFDGNLLLEYEAAPNVWTFVASSPSMSPSGKAVYLTAATPLANLARTNRYRVRLDSTAGALRSRGGNDVIAFVDAWDDVAKRFVRRPVDEATLTFWTRVVTGQNGPLLSFGVPLEAFAVDPTQSDTDVTLASGRADAGAVIRRIAEDTTPCAFPNPATCSLALREPLTQSIGSPAPNPNSKGPSKIQFQYNSYQHAPTLPDYKLPDAEVLTNMSWRPRNDMAIRASYPQLHIELAPSNRDSRDPNAPAILPSTTYGANIDVPPPTLVRDGSTPYVIPISRMTKWQSWDFERPFAEYRVDRGLVWTAWSEVGGDVEQYLTWYSPAASRTTRLFSSPSATINPNIGQIGQWTYYHTRFEFKRMRSVAVTNYYRVVDVANARPQFSSAVVSPFVGQLPSGTSYTVEYSGAQFANYVQRTAGGRTFFEGSGTPTRVTPFSSNIGTLNGFPAVAARVVFHANVDVPRALPFVDGIALTFALP